MAFDGSTRDPKVAKAPIAGSAKVTIFFIIITIYYNKLPATPNIKAIVKIPHSRIFIGNLFPNNSPNGIKANFNPSINNIKPITTAKRPPKILGKSSIP